MNTPLECTLTSHDGTELFYRAWHPVVPSNQALLLFHRGHEHSGRLAELVRDLALEDVHVFAWDARGHGRSPGERGSAQNLAVVIKDAEWFVRAVSRLHGIPLENMAVLAHSVGAVIAAAWVHDYAPPLCALVLAAPAFRVKLYVPLAIPALRLRQRVFGLGFVRSYVKAKMLTHDPAQAAAYDADPLIFKQIAVNILLDLHDTSTRLVADAGAIRVPTLMLAAGTDWVVQRAAQETFYRNLGSTRKAFCLLPGFYHALFHEQDRMQPIAKSRAFLQECFRDLAPLPSLLQADRGGFTKTEYDLLAAPRPLSPWVGVKVAMATLGRLSQGIRLGWERGFDSGETLDYVYANRAQGKTALGVLLDRAYLGSVGWRGIRQRKIHLEALLCQALAEFHHQGREVHIVDIAAGVGRYVLETLKAMPHVRATALLRDYKEANLDAGRRLAQELGVEGVDYQWGDAFDRTGLASLAPRPDIAIISGLFELVPENVRVLDSLRGLAEVMEPGACLIYTNQPWHPQLEFIARVLVNREGQPWVMRRRTQAEMDELVASVGFEKRSMTIDPWGIFTVSLAVRR
jgi:alpha-beta hydrolase superfamily lysophospholipase/SAM-dependent methyltransferase